MAGPSFIHYNTTTNIVSNVYTTSQTALAGHTQVNETHPVFLPTPQETRWQRTGVGAYTDIGRDSTIITDPPATQTWSFCGVVADIDTNEIVGTSWGSSNTATPLTALKDGEIIGFSGTLESALTAGQILLRFTINGVQQTGAGQTITFNTGSPTTNRLLLATPIAFVAGDRITLTATSNAAYTPANNDMTVAAWLRDK